MIRISSYKLYPHLTEFLSYSFSTTVVKYFNLLSLEIQTPSTLIFHCLCSYHFPFAIVCTVFMDFLGCSNINAACTFMHSFLLAIYLHLI